MLLQEGIQLEDIGGDVQSVPISALKGTNIPALMDAILLQVSKPYLSHINITLGG
jgi:translation initiation factor IF-2